MANTTFATTSIKHLTSLIGAATAVVPDLNLVAEIQQIKTNPELSAEIPVVTDVGTVQTAAAYDYETSAVVVDNLPASPTKFCLPFSVDNVDLQGVGLTVAQIVNSALAKFESAIWDTTIAPLLAETNFTVAVQVGSAAFAGSDVDTMLASVRGRERVIVADADYVLKIKPNMLPATGTTRVLECNQWTAAGTGVQGFASTDKRGLVVQVGLPLATSNQAMRSSREVITLPGLRIPAELTTWHNGATKADHACLIAYVSAVVADASGLKLLKSL
jgi:hypothetical protein